MMRVLRGIAAFLVWVVATVVLIVAGILCITLILLPLGIPLMALGLRLYGYGIQLMMPRAPEIKRGLRKRAGLRAHGTVSGDVKRAGTSGKKAGRKLKKNARGIKDDAKVAGGRGRDRTKKAARRTVKSVRG